MTDVGEELSRKACSAAERDTQVWCAAMSGPTSKLEQTCSFFYALCQEGGWRMAIGYRAVLRLTRGQSAVAAAEEQVRTWLKGKVGKRPAQQARVDWDGPGHYAIGRGLELLVVHADHDEQTPRRLYRIIEANPSGRWIVSVYAGTLVSKRGGEQTIVVEVDLSGADREAALAKVAPPKIVRTLLDTYDASDGSVQLTGTPNVVRSAQIEDLLAAIADPNRTASVVVALSPARDLDDAWRKVVGSLTRQSVGVTAAYVVYHDAAEAFAEALPVSHRFHPGQIRTFLPDVEFDSPSDAIRHRWLALPTLTRSLQRGRVAEPLQRRHGEDARRRFVEAQLPADVQRMIELLRRSETGIERAARVQAIVAKARAVTPLPAQQPVATESASDVAQSAPEAPAASSPWRERITAMLRRWLGRDPALPKELDDLDTFIEAKVAEVQVATDQLAEAAGSVENLQAEVVRLRREREDMELEWAVALEARQNADRDNTVLRRRLAASRQPGDAYVEPDTEDWAAPSTVEELVRRLTAGDDEHHVTARVVFTGDDDGAIEIDRRYPSGVYATAFWLHVRVLHDYAEARLNGFNGGLHMYLGADAVAGTKCPPGQHAAKESQTVLNNTRWSAERVFSVPTTVREGGTVLMEAHFKPTWRDTFAPRLYYYDDVAGTGKVYIGYIGRHLTNTQT
ncbi:hypothetical protein ASG04_03755 [Curtobacterium sp. Leaf183]|uniref:hypothetical protein n=1 Tax=Curtobacterium sp. Leaf183 TaxID=1736291 RepID=UPI0006F6AD89|nr:hypothetical protein [Curtobacterium sp. Leaf183]KQS10612.1 hypothetical protein ASG04_03755 [Curtobacterium sp. Leaf183]